jgi:Protein of unknown function (DUF551)
MTARAISSALMAAYRKGLQGGVMLPHEAAAIAADLVGEWQDIATAPKTGVLVLVRQEKGNDFAGTFVAYWSELDDAWLYARGRTVRRPTHWMPLPAPPQERA